MDALRDPVSSASHFLTAGLVAVASVFLLRLTARDRVARQCALVYGACATFLYFASGLFHALRLPREELRPFQLLDMSAIYLMIAGSATPLVVVLVPGKLRTNLLAGIWGFSGLGIVALWAGPKPDVPMVIGCYAVIAAVACVGLPHYWRATGWAGGRWFLAALGFYTAGALFELAHWPTLWPGVVGPHDLLHLCDIAGTAFHLVYLVRYVLPYRTATVGATVQVGEAAVTAESLQPRRAAA